MRFEADPWQRFFVYWMMFGETPEQREPMKSKTPIKSAALRQQLVAENVLRVESRRTQRERGPATTAQHYVLTDRAWDFAVQNLGKPLPTTKLAASVLQKVLARVQKSTERGLFSFAELATDAISPPAPPPPTEQEVREACLSIGGGHVGKRIRLAALREKLPARREALDSVLQAMQQAGRLVLFKMDNPAEITAEDEQAALLISGNPRHLVYLEA